MSNASTDQTEDTHRAIDTARAAEEDLIREDIHAFLDQNEAKELMRFVTVGSVDDGKSTLIGRLLYDSKGIFEDQLQAIERTSAARGHHHLAM